MFKISNIGTRINWEGYFMFVLTFKYVSGEEVRLCSSIDYENKNEAMEAGKNLVARCGWEYDKSDIN